MIAKLAALLALCSLAYTAPIGKEDNKPYEFLTIAENEPATDMKVLTIAGSTVRSFPQPANDNAAGLHFAYLDSNKAATITLSVRIERCFRMRHARFNFTLTNIKTGETESMMQYAYELEHICSEGGMHRGEAHAFTCKKEAAIKTMKDIKLPLDWTKEKFQVIEARDRPCEINYSNKERLQNEASVMRIVMVTDEEEVIFNTAFFAILL